MAALTKSKDAHQGGRDPPPQFLKPLPHSLRPMRNTVMPDTVVGNMRRSALGGSSASTHSSRALREHHGKELIRLQQGVGRARKDAVRRVRGRSMHSIGQVTHVSAKVPMILP